MTTHSIRYRERAARDGEHLPAEPTCTELAHLRAAITLAEPNLMRAKSALWVLLIRRRMLCSSRWVIPGLAEGVTGWLAGQR